MSEDRYQSPGADLNNVNGYLVFDWDIIEDTQQKQQEVGPAKMQHKVIDSYGQQGYFDNSNNISVESSQNYLKNSSGYYNHVNGISPSKFNSNQFFGEEDDEQYQVRKVQGSQVLLNHAASLGNGSNNVGSNNPYMEVQNMDMIEKQLDHTNYDDFYKYLTEMDFFNLEQVRQMNDPILMDTFKHLLSLKHKFQVQTEYAKRIALSKVYESHSWLPEQADKLRTLSLHFEQLVNSVADQINPVAISVVFNYSEEFNRQYLEFHRMMKISHKRAKISRWNKVREYYKNYTFYKRMIRQSIINYMKNNEKLIYEGRETFEEKLIEFKRFQEMAEDHKEQTKNFIQRPGQVEQVSPKKVEKMQIPPKKELHRSDDQIQKKSLDKSINVLDMISVKIEKLVDFYLNMITPYNPEDETTKNDSILNNLLSNNQTQIHKSPMGSIKSGFYQQDLFYSSQNQSSEAQGALNSHILNNPVFQQQSQINLNNLASQPSHQQQSGAKKQKDSISENENNFLMRMLKIFTMSEIESITMNLNRLNFTYFEQAIKKQITENQEVKKVVEYKKYQVLERDHGFNKFAPCRNNRINKQVQEKYNPNLWYLG